MVSEFLSDVETDYDSMIGEESGWCFSQILKGNTVKTRNNEFEKNKHSCPYCQKKSVIANVESKSKKKNVKELRQKIHYYENFHYS